MAIDPEQRDVVREALDAADSLDASAVVVAAEQDTLVLRGSVATFEESSAALTIAEQHADAVRNELRVDVNLREGTGDGEAVADRNRPQDLQGSALGPADEADDLVDDMQESLAENLPWDPPHEAVEVPTRAEARGIGDRSGDDDGPPDEQAGAKSLPDLSPEELTRGAHPEPRDEENA